MPKGDKSILKADPEDGTTPIANLLLEALVIAKLTSKERGACLFLIRRTYGWQINGQRLKEAKIPFKDWTMALSTDNSHASTLLAGLEHKGVIKRRYVGPTGKDRGYFYSINTRVAEWSNTCLNQQLLREIANMKLPKTEIQLLPKTEIQLLPKSVTSPRTNYIHGKKLKAILNKDDKDIDDIFIRTTGQSLEKALRIARGELEAAPRVKERIINELIKYYGTAWGVVAEGSN